MRLCLAATLAAAATVLVLFPQAAWAHGLVGRSDLPIPDWLFTWAAGIVLIVSFVALAVLWPTPRLQTDQWRPLSVGLSRVVTSRPLDVACGALGVSLFAVVVWSGFTGAANATENFAPTFVYVIFWLGLVVASVLFGDVFRAFNPWRALGRAFGWTLKRLAGVAVPPPARYPPRLGRWPAVAGLLAFGWLELAAPGGDEPDTLATAALIYSALTFVGMALYGVEAWSARGEAFSVYFNLFSRISIFEPRDRLLGRRPPLGGLPQLDPQPGTVALVCSIIGIVSFDGLSAGTSWNSVVVDAQPWFADLGLSAPRTLEVMFGIGMLATVALVFLFYRLGIAGMRTTGGGLPGDRLAATFAHSLAPIALAYTAAHYVSLLLLQGQALAPLASDPLGDGSNLFGTAGWTIDYAFLGAETFWYLQVGFVVLGHVAALVLAHDRALVVYPVPKQAVRSQYWMLGVMIGFTTLALWLLSEGSKG